MKPMSDLVLRLAGAACRAKGLDPNEFLGVRPPPTSDDGMITYDVMLPHYRWHDEVDAVRAVAGELLAVLREPSEAMVLAYWDLSSGPLMEAHVERVQDVFGAVLDAFARGHGLEDPDGG